MGWYGDKYIIYIVRDHDWDDPLYMFSAVDEKELMHIMFKCKHNIEYDINHS